VVLTCGEVCAILGFGNWGVLSGTDVWLGLCQPRVR